MQPVIIGGFKDRKTAESGAELARQDPGMAGWTITVDHKAGEYRVVCTPPGTTASAKAKRVSATSFHHPKATQAVMRPLMELIGAAESGGDYNASHSAADALQFTDMNLKNVIAWQDDYQKRGDISSGVGKYNLLRKTVRDLKREHGLSDQMVFNQPLQDELALAVLEKCGVSAYLSGMISENRFINNLAMEWAGLPDMTGQSYYRGDGRTTAKADLKEVQSVVSGLKSS